jgi:hypothetical protein
MQEVMKTTSLHIENFLSFHTKASYMHNVNLISDSSMGLNGGYHLNT